jgi:uncharacterized caspase-like protein
MAEKRSALVVATSEYEDARLAPLAGPAQDAEALEEVLANAEIGGFDVQLALNAQHDDLRRTLEGFFSERGRDDLLLVHFSGHGLKDDEGQLYLAAADTRIDRLMSTGVEAGWVNRLMTRCRSERIALFLDCCFGGAFTTGLTRRAGVDTAGVNETFNGSGRFVITASDAMQYSFEGGQRVDDGQPQPSPFTSSLVEGLATGEADRNEDGFVSINELFDYLEDRVHQLSPSQTPTKSAFNQVGDWVIAQSIRAPTIRILPASVQTLLKSEDAMDRLASLIDLRDLIQGSDPRVADAATKALEKLTGDDSRRVAAAASRVFGDMPRASAGVVVPSTPLSKSDLPQAVIDALQPTPTDSDVALTATSEPRAASAEATTPVGWAGLTGPSPATPERSTAGDPDLATLVKTGPAATPPAEVPPRAETITPSTQSPEAGALWGQPAGAAPVYAAPSIAPQPGVGAATQPPFSLGRALGRAALGAFIATFLQLFYFAGTNADVLQDTSIFDQYTTWFASVMLYFIVGATVLAGILEGAAPALRVPSGSAWTFVGQNRWLVAAIVGALMGLTVGVIAETLVLGTDFAGKAGTGLEIVVFASVGWLLAEVVVGRRAAPRTAAA